MKASILLQTTVPSSSPLNFTQNIAFALVYKDKRKKKQKKKKDVNHPSSQ